eukprot:9087981-Pyramimonas_sp.AAC.1
MWSRVRGCALGCSHGCYLLGLLGEERHLSLDKLLGHGLGVTALAGAVLLHLGVDPLAAERLHLRRRDDSVTHARHTEPEGVTKV